MRSVPVMSDGIRSGVNWMRENFSASTCASVYTSSVFASPGTPMMRLLPPVKSVSSTSLTTSSWPMIALRSSVRMRSRPVFIRSARATSSGDSRSRALLVTKATCPPLSVGDAVDEVVDAVLVRFVVDVDGREARARELPVLADIAVHVRDRKEPLLRIVVLEDAVIAEDHRLVVDRRRRQ